MQEHSANNYLKNFLCNELPQSRTVYRHHLLIFNQSIQSIYLSRNKDTGPDTKGGYNQHLQLQLLSSFNRFKFSLYNVGHYQYFTRF